ncbi:MAG TPA: CocE/NonD family hydrolase [Microbacterium sp.]|uniref:CocE/NonD family hydrolase n=1 Tax=Microbacterium sp. TaxID=51671 RepID=UPI002B48868B|nr:CocE/NonD family hydrolase [Microbacterium sp.]HKT58161.1 CocE/NonD family hydrolase [Microbacterium sp.]
MKHLLADIRWAATKLVLAASRIFVLPFKTLKSAHPILFRRVRRLSHLTVTMRDGVRLNTDVYLPIGAPASPVMLIRMPYGIRESYTYMPAVGRYWAQHGFACVIQDVRGRFGSEGVWQPGAHEKDDGFDTIAWIAAQPWCDGRVSMTGESYYALTQWAAAAARPPALVSIAPGDMGLDQHTMLYEGGAFCLGTTGMWLCDQSGRDYINYYRLDTTTRPVTEMARRGGITAPLFEAAALRPERSEFWDEYDFSDLIDGVAVPVLVWSGWFDNLLPGTIHTWNELERRRPGGAQRLLLGPTDHETSVDFDGRVGRIPVAEASRSWDRVLEFTEDVLRGWPENGAQRPRTSAFIVGADTWIDDTAVPTGEDRTVLWLREDGTLAASAGEGTLGYTYDPDDPVRWWAARDLWAASRYLGDRRRIKDRDDVLRFDGAVLPADIDVLGATEVHLTVSYTAPSTDFTAALVDIFPDGHTQLVTEWIRRLRPEERSDAETSFVIRLPPTGYRFAHGHRIGLEISSSNFDRWDLNLNDTPVPATTAQARTSFQLLHLAHCSLALPTRRLA